MGGRARPPAAGRHAGHHSARPGRSRGRAVDDAERLRDPRRGPATSRSAPAASTSTACSSRTTARRPIEWDPRLAELPGRRRCRSSRSRTCRSTPTSQRLPTSSTARTRRRPHLVYLDVWQREVTHLQDPTWSRRRSASTRRRALQTVWQVQACCTDAGDVDLRDAATTTSTGWSALIRPSGARLTTATGDVPAIRTRASSRRRRLQGAREPALPRRDPPRRAGRTRRPSSGRATTPPSRRA